MDVKRNLSMLMDFYELTMSNGYFKKEMKDEIAVFDMFYRNNPDDAAYSIFCGLDDLIDYINNLHFDESDITYLRSLNLFDEAFLKYLADFKFKGTIYSFKEGSVVYPYEPLITVVAPLIDAQLVETALLLIINHETLIATKANRIYLSCNGRAFSDFGARRAHNGDAAIYGARASYIGGASSTATTLAAKKFDIKVSGTMAHSWVMSFDSEYEAFKAYAEIYPNNAVLLIDTYDVLNQGVRNAIKVANEFLIPRGYRLKGVRIDSGDLAYLSKECRKILDEAGLNDCQIVVSNSLDEFKIKSLIEQGAKIDLFGVGENLITSKSNPVFGGVYKLAAIKKGDELIPKIKLSESVEKITNPGLKDVYRVYSKEGKIMADLIAIKDEELDEKNIPFVYPAKPWKDMKFEDVKLVNMRHKIFDEGKLVYKRENIEDIKRYVRHQVDDELWEEERRFVMPHIHYLDYTTKFYELKMKLIKEHRNER